MSGTTREIMKAVPKGAMNGLSELSLAIDDILNMAKSIELLTWDFSSDDKGAMDTVQAVSGVAMGIAAISETLEDFIGALEVAERKP